MKPLPPPALLPEIVLNAYAHGFFPMADSLDKTAMSWFNPPQRAVLPIRGVRIPRSLRQLIRKKPFEIKVDTAFDAVIEACAAPTDDRPDTWLNDDIIGIFKTLHRAGFAHSVECWQDGKLAGGL